MLAGSRQEVKKKQNENKSSKLLQFFKNDKMCVFLQYFVLVYHFICENKVSTSIYIHVTTQMWNSPFREMDKQIVHFMKWSTQPSISWNGQIHIYFAIHFMKWTKSCMKVKFSFMVNLLIKVIHFIPL